jgi:hypothetical protein
MNKTVTVKYGIDQFTTEVPNEYTIGDLKADERIKTAVGCGDNINALIDGVAQNDTVLVPNLSCVKFETKANVKG